MRAMVSPALPALTVLTASIERLGQSCARAAGAKMIRTAHAPAPHHVRNDIDTSLECGRNSIDFVARGLAHDAPNPGARATGGARPALVRRTRRNLTPAGHSRNCFAEFRKSGLTHPMMADIERELGVSRERAVALVGKLLH